MNVTFDQGVVFVILSVTIVLFVWGRWRYDLVAMAALLLVFAAGQMPPGEVFLGFGHPAVITVAAVLIISRGLLNAGVVDGMSRYLVKAGDNLTLQLAALTGIVALCSGFMNNVGALALFIPVAVWMSRQSGRPPSLLLMPLAFGSLLGGLTTLIGTPPNIIISAYRAETGAPAFGMFDFAPVGVGVAVVGVIFIALVGWKLTPQRQGLADSKDLFLVDDYISEVRVPEGARVVGHPISKISVDLGKGTDAVVVGLVRGDEHFPAPPAYEVIEAGDILLVEATSDELEELVDGLGLELAETRVEHRDALESDEVQIIEAIVTFGSSITDQTATSMRLRSNFGVNLLAIARQGHRLQSRLGHTPFAVGDILLLQGRREVFRETLATLNCLPLAERGIRFVKPKRIFLSLGIFGAAMAATALGLAPVQVAFIAAALTMVVVGLVELKEIYDSVDWPVIILLAAMFPLGHALERTGGAQLIADQLLLLSVHFSPVGMLAALMVGTMLLSNVVNNAAAAVLMAPIAISLSTGMGVSVDPLLMAVVVGASCAFLTPVGHQSNALVMVPGGYRFGDYWRLGLPLSIAVILVAVPLIAMFWRF